MRRKQGREKDEAVVSGWVLSAILHLHTWSRLGCAHRGRLNNMHCARISEVRCSEDASRTAILYAVNPVTRERS